MTDEMRSHIMASIRSVSMLERRVQTALKERGISFATNVIGMFGTPDIYKFDTNAVVFIDSCFWHGCPEHYKEPKTNVDFWRKKISRNAEHDKVVTEAYMVRNYRVLRVWEHELKSDWKNTIDKIASFLLNKRS